MIILLFDSMYNTNYYRFYNVYALSRVANNNMICFERNGKKGKKIMIIKLFDGDLMLMICVQA